VRRGRAAEVWYAAGLRFTCTRCGECCRGPAPGYVEVDEAQIERLAAHLELTPQAFTRRYVRWLSTLGLHSLTEKKNGDCIFWSDDAGCTVYEARPTQCRTFPFWPEVVASPEAWDEHAEACPGMTQGKAGAGRLYAREEIDALVGGQGETSPTAQGTRGRRLRRAGDDA
jgi:Fe-S-cluster containining protein